MKKAEKEQALNLRKRGFTLREIAKYTNVSVSTISLWLKGEAWSQKITDDNQSVRVRRTASAFPYSIRHVVINTRSFMPKQNALQ